MQSYVTIQHDTFHIIINYDDMKNVHYNYWERLYDNMPIMFNLTNDIILNSNSENVIFTINIIGEKQFTIPLEECQQIFRKYYNKLSHSNLHELLKNSFC